MSNDENENSATWTSNATKPKLTPCEKTKTQRELNFHNYHQKDAMT
jgi:hypothetical protein